MTKGSDDSRIIAACANCGSMYAALEVSEGDIQPIGSRSGCASCAGTEFTPLPQFSSVSEPAEPDADD